ncbi:MAG: hypothetical protein KIS66_03960 [Fimbriimonadaceae bacterium]|nr:hypothetical protein [Fimbriimonadaceae bacterium]
MRTVAVLSAAVLLTATLLVLALPPVGWHPFGWVAFVPVLIASRERGLARGFGLAMAAMLAGALLTRLGWLYRPSLLDGSPAWNYAGFAVFGVAGGLACGVWAETTRRSKWRPALVAAWAVLFEAALLLYLPAHLALTQARVPAMLNLASWTGIWGVSFLVWLANLSLAEFLAAGKGREAAAIVLLIGLVVTLAPFGPGSVAGSVRVAALQTPVGSLDDLANRNKRAGELGAELVVWPELSALAIAPGGDTKDLRDLSREVGQPPFLTTFEDDAKPLPHNVAALFNQGVESPRYAKRKPFGGERFVRAAGNRPTAVPVSGLVVGLNVCFDSCFPAVIRDTAVLPEVGLILLPTQDPVAPFGTVQAFHAAYTPFRAAEAGVPVVRADGTAYSMITDSQGRVVAEGGSGTDEILVADVIPERRWTLYRTLGDWFLWPCGLGCALALFGSWRRGALTLRPNPKTRERSEPNRRGVASPSS